MGYLSQITGDILCSIIEEDVNGPSSLLGYHGMWNLLLLKYEILVSRCLVMSVLRGIEPNATEQRKSHNFMRRKYLVKWTNDIWHTDGLDKLQPYCLLVHATIDGFSCKHYVVKYVNTILSLSFKRAFFLKK